MRKKICSVGAVIAAACVVVVAHACSSTGSAGGAGRARSQLVPSDANGGASVGAPESSRPLERPVPAYAAAVENTGADCTLPELADAAQLAEHAELPDPFEKLAGTRLTKRSEWRCRRQEIRAQAEKYIYGQKPPKPEHVSGSVSNDAVSVDVEHAGKRIHFSAEIVLPPQGSGPFPVMINLGKRSGFGGIRLGESFILEQGVAIIFYNHNELGTEGKPEASRGLPNPGLFYDVYGGKHSAGLLMAWAWGASRIIDVLQQSGGSIIDASRIGVTGCSRNGKGAFTVGAFDERIALTIPQETSTGGLPAYRIVDVTNGAERTNWNFYGLNWLSNDFQPFVEHATRLPIDSHEVVALLAPRGLLVLDNPHIPQFAAVAAHTAVLAGAEVYAALGAPENISYISDVADEKHCAVGKPEYTEALVQNIAKFLKHERGATSGVIKASPKATGNPAQWIHWQTPTLENDLAN
jgi:glucuronyl esterase-like protein